MWLLVLGMDLLTSSPRLKTGSHPGERPTLQTWIRQLRGAQRTRKVQTGEPCSPAALLQAGVGTPAPKQSVSASSPPDPGPQ